MTEFILVLALLTTESSYKSEIERPATTTTDTVQFWLGSKEPWRIRTYAIDHDIHIHNLGTGRKDSHFSANNAEVHLNKNYSDILKKIYIIVFKDPNNKLEVANTLKEHGLSGSLEVAPAGFAFYNPDGKKYRSQSSPK